MLIFDEATRPNPEVLFKRNDPNDRRLGEVVLTTQETYARASVVLLGLPQDEGVARNGGRIGASQAPDAIRQAFYKLVDIPRLSLFDLGNTRLADTLEATHDRHQAIVEHVLRDGKTLVVLGGGNDTSYPDALAVSRVMARDVLAFNIDAHFDVRIAPQRNSGTPYRQLLEENALAPTHFHEVAYNPSANSPIYIDYLRQKGVAAHSLAQVQARGIGALLESILSANTARAIFWGVDMDVVNAAEAMGVSAPNALGLTAHELITLAQVAGRERRTKLFEITEVNPAYDSDGRTSRLAAVAIWHFLQEQATHTQDSL